MWSSRTRSGEIRSRKRNVTKSSGGNGGSKREGNRGCFSVLSFLLLLPFFLISAEKKRRQEEEQKERKGRSKEGEENIWKQTIIGGKRKSKR